MPHTPDPDDDIGLDDSPAPPAIHFAEQAVLGALLQEPHQIRSLGGLEPRHFANPFHAAIYTAIRTLTPPTATEHTQSPAWPRAVLHAAGEHVRGLTPGYLYGLLSACPTPQHTTAYARMVHLDHARRTVRAGALRLMQAADGPCVPERAEATMEEADSLAALIDGVAARFAIRQGPRPRTPEPVPPPRDTGPDACEEERMLLATALTHPEDFTALHRQLRPEDFTDPLHRALFHALTTLAQRGTPLDPVTVLWETQHTGLPDGTEPGVILALLTAAPGYPDYWAEKILQRSLLHHAHTTARRIHAYTEDPANTPHQLLTGSRRALADLAVVRTRWHQATTPTPPATPARPAAPAPTAASTARAGPPRLATTPPAARRATR